MDRKEERHHGAHSGVVSKINPIFLSIKVWYLNNPQTRSKLRCMRKSLFLSRVSDNCGAYLAYKVYGGLELRYCSGKAQARWGRTVLFLREEALGFVDLENGIIVEALLSWGFEF